MKPADWDGPTAPRTLEMKPEDWAKVQGPVLLSQPAIKPQLSSAFTNVTQANRLAQTPVVAGTYMILTLGTAGPLPGSVVSWLNGYETHEIVVLSATDEDTRWFGLWGAPGLGDYEVRVDVRFKAGGKAYDLVAPLALALRNHGVAFTLQGFAFSHSQAEDYTPPSVAGIGGATPGAVLSGLSWGIGDNLGKMLWPVLALLVLWIVVKVT